MWGAWWVWDARLTSVLVLFFLYLGHIALVRAFDDPQRGYRAGAILALVGIDQPADHQVLRRLVEHAASARHDHASPARPKCMSPMLWPLLLSALGFTFAFAAIVVARLRAAVMERRVRALLMARAERVA